MLTVPPAAQATLAAYSDAQLKTALTTALRDVAYGLWEAERRGYVVNSLVRESRTGPLNQADALEVLAKVSKVVQL